MSFLVSRGYSLHDVLDYENGLTHSQLALFTTKATKQYLIEGRNQVEGMTVALASLFKGDILKKYMEETTNMIKGLDDEVAGKVPERPKAKQTADAKRAMAADSMNKLGELTSLFAGTWQPRS